MIPIHKDSQWQGISDCKNCGIREMALFADLQDEDFSLIHTPIDTLKFEASEIVYSENQHAGYLFTIRHGAIKLVRNASDGRERIVRVLRTSDVFGLEALLKAQYETEAIALETTELCRIPLEVIHQLSQQTPRLHQRLMERWHKALKDADDWIASINFGSARQRVAQMILKLRLTHTPDITALYSRQDMGAMSDLKLETVSREMSRWTQLGVIQPLDKKGRMYKIMDEETLLNA